ncbi:MAG: NAD(P)/FAD-dependent oxidoreductase [Gammaproteobacteria bacterium]|nr:NAD(P)/FAD-dependent oxidoreductase [Gammaproteobacteria bacterium]
MKMVIIGNGPAAIAAVEAIRDVDQSCEIIMIAKEEEPCYSPCPLAEYVEGAISRENLFFRNEDFYERLKLTTLFGREALRIDTTASEVVMVDGERISYDRVLIAIGSRAFFPPIPGLNSTNGVFALKTLADAEGILQSIGTVKNAVVIGSGFIGLEAAQGLIHHGVSVTVLEVRDQVLPQMLDADLALEVQRLLEERAITVMLNAGVEEVIGEQGITAVKVDGEFIDCDLLICAAGVRPELSIVEGADIQTNHGIVVDDQMVTSHPDVFAAGDIIETNDINGQQTLLPTWPNAVNSGRIAGYNMQGQRSPRFIGLEAINVLRVFDVPMGSFGVTEGDRILEYSGEGVRKRLVIKENRIAGMQVLGDVSNMGLYLEMMKKRRDVSSFGDSLLSPEFGYGHTVNTVAHKTAFATAVV